MSGRAPIIGIDCSSRKTSESASSPTLTLPMPFVAAVERAGGVPVVIPTRIRPDTVDAILDALDGLLITGGPDIVPEMYGAGPHPIFHPMSDNRAENSGRLIRRAVEARKPVLGVCFGFQLMNVVFGGTLLPDIHTVTHPRRVKHKYNTCPEFTDHPAALEPGSRVCSIMGGESQMVNSCHHQAVDRVGDGLRATAKAPDDVVEALELADSENFFLGVQWHPEYLIHRPEHQALFDALVKAADVGVRLNT